MHLETLNTCWKNYIWKTQVQAKLLFQTILERCYRNNLNVDLKDGDGNQWRMKTISYYASILFSFVFFFFVSFHFLFLKILNEVYYALWRFKLWDTIYKQWDPTNLKPGSATFHALARSDLSIYPLIYILSFILLYVLWLPPPHFYTTAFLHP